MNPYIVHAANFEKSFFGQSIETSSDYRLAVVLNRITTATYSYRRSRLDPVGQNFFTSISNDHVVDVTVALSPKTTITLGYRDLYADIGNGNIQTGRRRETTFDGTINYKASELWNFELLFRNYRLTTEPTQSGYEENLVRFEINRKL